MKREILSAIGVAVVVMILAVLLFKGVILLSDASAALAYVLVAAIFGILLWGFEPRIKRSVRGKSLEATAPKFRYLTIHYSQRTDTPDTSNPARPRFVTITGENKAYWVSDFLEPHVRRREISCVSHDGESAIRKYFAEQKIDVIERNPLPEELGLRLLKDGSLLSEEEVKKADELLNKLKDCKLNDLRVVCLYPWYCYLFPSLQGSIGPKRLLLKFSTMKAFESPLHDLELIENEILDWQNYSKRPWDSCKRWCKRHGYTFTPRRYSETELTGEM